MQDGKKSYDLKIKIERKMNYRNSNKYVIVLISALIIFTTSCKKYDDFVENEFDYTTVYFPYGEIDRTFRIDEGMYIKVGVVLGGILSSKEDVTVKLSLDTNLVNSSGYTVLPDNLYTLQGIGTDSTFTVLAGEIQGFVTVKADSASFLSDPMALGHQYALGFKITDVTGADSILENKSNTVITFSYINQLFGNYFQDGVATRKKVSDGSSMDPVTYSADIQRPVELTMLGPNTVLSNALGDFRFGGGFNDVQMELTLNNNDGISIAGVSGKAPVTDNGGSVFNRADREIILNYSFTLNDVIYNAKDTLKFRNRIVDGVNQTSL